MGSWSGRKATELTRLVLETDDMCHICKKPGADSADHIIPRSLGGSDTLDNLAPAHLWCNKKRGNRRLGASVVVVTGPPCSGKSTYVNDHAGPNDVVIDLDALALALMPPGAHHHVYPPHVRHVAIGARNTAIARATRLSEQCRVFLIHADPTPEQRREYRRHQWRMVDIDPGKDVCLARARVPGARPPSAVTFIHAWYTHRHPTSADHPNTPSRPWLV